MDTVERGYEMKEKGKWMKEKWKILIVCTVLLYALIVVNVYMKQQNGGPNTESREVENGVFENVWITHAEEKQMVALVEGELRHFSLGQKVEPLENVVGDLTLSNGVVKKIVLKEDTIQGKVQAVQEDSIEIEGYGELPLEKEYKVYQTYDQLTQKQWSDVLVGYDQAKFVVADGKVCAALLTNPVEVGNIRVLLKNGENENYHDKIVLTADCGFSIDTGKEVLEYGKGEKVTLVPNCSYFDGKNRIVIASEQENGKIQVLSSQKTEGQPAYRGTLEVDNKKQGLLLINELPLEQYLYGVVGSEMPESYGLEALKVQAVCARSYAYKQLLANGCGKYGAHVDDTVSYQVYNNIQESDTVIEAVNATNGEVMKVAGEVVTAYYFATSCGYTADSSDVWQGEEQQSYLTGDLQNDSGKAQDLSEEKNFRKFIDDAGADTYDSEFPWYRWRVSMTGKQLGKSVEQQLQQRYERNPDCILTKQKNGKFASKPIETVGNVKSLNVLERGKSGVIRSIEIVGTQATIRVEQEYNIRLLLAPVASTIYRNDNSKIEEMQMLPSGFFYVTKNEDTFTFCGGGYGHGVGMSQNGAKAMADQGFHYKEILSHYYKGVTFAVIGQ